MAAIDELGIECEFHNGEKLIFITLKGRLQKGKKEKQVNCLYISFRISFTE